MPIVAPTSTCTSPTTQGSETSWMTCMAIRAAASVLSVERATITNSSPPSLATKSSGSQDRRDALRNRHQERVTDAVTVQIVDELEVVEVDEHDGEGKAILRRTLDQALEAEVVGSPVGQAGQSVGESQAMDLRLGFVPSLHLAPEIGNPPPAIGETEEPEEEQRGDERVVEVPGIALDMVGNVLEELAIRGDGERRQRDESGSRRFPKGTVGSQKRAYAREKERPHHRLRRMSACPRIAGILADFSSRTVTIDLQLPRNLKGSFEKSGARRAADPSGGRSNPGQRRRFAACPDHARLRRFEKEL